MANTQRKWWCIRTKFGAISAISLSLAGGCAFPHGTTQGDPLLGNWNRPIAPSPMPYAGQGGGGSPAYDGGARIGMPSPDVLSGPGKPLPYGSFETNPAAKTSWVMPAPAAPNNVELAGGKPKPRASWFFSPLMAQQSQADGAKLQTEQPRVEPLLPNRPSYDSYPPGYQAAARPAHPSNAIVPGSAMAPEMHSSALRLVTPESPEAVKVQTIEEGQLILAGYGLKWHNMAQVDNGDWQYSCVIASDWNGNAYRRYDARHAHALEAVRAVVEQAKRDKR
jgi:hypothetical protein